MTRPITTEAMQLLRQFEGCSLISYQDVAGIWTQGFGHRKGVTSISTPITQETAEQWLADDLLTVILNVEEDCDAVLNDNQFSAVVLLCFNVGSGPLFGKLGRHLEEGNFSAAADDFLAWDHAHIGGQLEEVPGLTRRRIAERALFLKDAPCSGAR